MIRRFSLPKIYPLTESAADLSHSEQVERFASAGATLVQIREKQASSLEFFREAENCLEALSPFETRLIINDRVDIAAALDADGVHLGQDDLPPDEARKILGNKAIIGFSTHSLRQAQEALNMAVDYIAIGPIFRTRTKAGEKEPVGLRTIEAVRNAIGDMPLVAIGGINFENIADVLSAGADSAAMISALTSPPIELENRFRMAMSIADRFG